MQYARPTSTVLSATWGFVGASFHGAIADVVTPGNEDVDTTYIFATAGGSVTDCEVALSTVTDPASSSDHTVYFKHKTTTVPPYAAPNDLTVSLYDGATLIASVPVSPTGTETESSFLLSGPEADAITDYSDLRIRAGYNYGGFGDQILIYNAYLAVPDAGAGTGGFSVTIAEPARTTTDAKSRPGSYSAKFHSSEHLVTFQDDETTSTAGLFMWAKATSRQDAKNGQICSATGYWFPARLVVYVRGKPFGQPFAPRR